MIAVVGEFRFPADRMDAARPLMRKVIEATLAEDGCLAYSYAEDVLDPGLVRVCEEWESQAHLDAHIGAQHMKVWAEERAALGMTGLAIRRLQVSDSAAM